LLDPVKYDLRKSLAARAAFHWVDLYPALSKSARVYIHYLDYFKTI
jgi:hypothetical protein